MKNRHIVSAVAVIAVLAVIAAFGCSRTKTIETEEGKITLTEKGDTFKIETDKGTLTMEGGQMQIKTDRGDAQITYGKDNLPEGLSKDIPIYKPSDVTMSQVLDGGKKVMLSLSTKDSSAKVKKYYEEAMTKNGWKINRKIYVGTSSVITGIKSKEQNKLNVSMKQEEDGTIISLYFEGK